MKHLFIALFILVIFCISLYAQKQIVEVPDYWDTGTEGTLNAAVQTAITIGTLSNTVFKLKPHGYYIQTGEIVVPSGQTLEIISEEPGNTQETAPPQILWKSVPPPVWPDYITDTTRNYFFNCYGDLTLKNIWVFCADEFGERVSSCIIFQHNQSDTDGRRCNFEGVILDYFPCPPLAGGTVTVACTNFRGFFKNCYWKNCTDPHFRYYGRALSFPYSSAGFYGDTLVFENCTFANIGYVLMQEGSEYYNYVKFNHCTFLNVLMYPLESGWWNKLCVTNSIFVNTFIFGNIAALSSYEDGEPNGSTIRIDSLSKKYYNGMYLFPFTEQDRRILFTHSSHYLEKWIRDWMWDNPYSLQLRAQQMEREIPVPQPMLSPGTLRFFNSTFSGQKVFPFMNKANLHDSTDPGFIRPPSDTGGIKSFLLRRWWDSSDTLWAWKPGNSLNRLWPIEENLAYTNETVKTAGIGGFPLGDLYHWWPAEYQQWKAQEASENDTINKWLHYGFNYAISVNEHPYIPDEFKLEQNYPNPFNPKTVISYKLKVKSEVRLMIYDILGREIITLVNEVKDAGAYSVEWNGGNSIGQQIGSGVYFYRLSANGYSETKKLVLLK
jgi:hypothetical protein